MSSLARTLPRTGPYRLGTDIKMNWLLWSHNTPLGIGTVEDAFSPLALPELSCKLSEYFVCTNLRHSLLRRKSARGGDKDNKWCPEILYPTGGCPQNEPVCCDHGISRKDSRSVSLKLTIMKGQHQRKI